MAYTLPDFILNVNLWRYPAYPPAPPDLTFMGNLAFGRRVSFLNFSDTLAPDAMVAFYLLVPPLTDVRDGAGPPSGDTVEVPAGSGRLYKVLYVDDLGKGFANEHRVAFIAKIWPWPVPIP